MTIGYTRRDVLKLGAVIGAGLVYANFELPELAEKYLKIPSAHADEPLEIIDKVVRKSVTDKESKAAYSSSEIQKPKYELTQEELELLAKTAYHEARGEPYDGKKAVVAVVLNRANYPIIPATLNKPYYPTTIEEVIKQPYQFTGIMQTLSRDDLYNYPVFYQDCWKAAAEVAQKGFEDINLTDLRTGQKVQFTDNILAFRAAYYPLNWYEEFCNGWKMVYAGTIKGTSQPGHHLYAAVRKQQ